MKSVTFWDSFSSLLHLPLAVLTLSVRCSPITASSGTNNTGVNCTYCGQDVRGNLILASTHTLKVHAYPVEPTLDDHFKELESLCVTKGEASGYASNQVCWTTV